MKYELLSYLRYSVSIAKTIRRWVCVPAAAIFWFCREQVRGRVFFHREWRRRRVTRARTPSLILIGVDGPHGWRLGQSVMDMCTLISAMWRSHIPPPAICRTRRNICNWKRHWCILCKCIYLNAIRGAYELETSFKSKRKRIGMSANIALCRVCKVSVLITFLN